MTRSSNKISIICMLCQLLVWSFISCSSHSPGVDKEKDASKEIINLIKTLDKADLYSGQRQYVIDSLKTELNHEPDSLRAANISMELARWYRQFESDSSAIYSIKALEFSPTTADNGLKIKARLALANALSTSGLFAEAKEIIDELSGSYAGYDNELKIEYWKSKRLFYAYGMAYLSDDNSLASKYRENYSLTMDSLLVYLNPNDPFCRFITAERLVGQQRWNEAKEILLDLMGSQTIESNIFGMSAFQLALVYKQQGDNDRYMQYLALAAESDIKGAVKEGLALPSIATVLYERGDLQNAFRFIQTALQQADHGNIRMRTVSIAGNLAVIDNAYKQNIEKSRTALLIFLIIACVLLVIVSALSGIMIRNARISKQKSRHLAVTSRKLQDNVGNFISLCSNYAISLEQLAKTVVRKINAGQTEELIKLLESGRYQQEDNEDFYKLIDKAILDIYPDFVDSINTLLRNENKIVSERQPDSLTPELRVYACVRLGVDQSAKIAQILHYSVNTVYAYRNRMRNRAINRDTFDRDVCSLGETFSRSSDQIIEETN